jgi:hypothetical protein
VPQPNLGQLCVSRQTASGPFEHDLVRIDSKRVGDGLQRGAEGGVGGRIELERCRPAPGGETASRSASLSVRAAVATIRILFPAKAPSDAC